MNDSNSTKTQRVSTSPLRGFLVAQSETEVAVRAGDGVWRFKPEDVLGITDWNDPPDPIDSSSSDRAVLVEVRMGARAEFTQSFRIEVADRPMTLPDSWPEVAQSPGFDALAEAWSEGLQFLGEPWPDGGVTRTSCASASDAKHSDDWFLCDSLD